MATSVTLQDVADAAGVHRSTVALALRDNARISAAKRKAIQDLARRMGYHINPFVAALMTSRRSGSGARAVTLAYVTCHPTRWGWRPPNVDRPDYFPGAAARAAELGCRLEHFWLAEPGMTVPRFCEVLTNRAITGVLIGRLPPGKHSIDLLWDRFSCVALGRTLHEPSIHRVTEDHFASCCVAMNKLQAAGYRRIGFVFSEADDSPGVGDRWIGGYLRSQLRLDAADRLPCFMYNPGCAPVTGFSNWLERWKPDALIVTQAVPTMGWLKALRKKVPRDIGLATLVNDHLKEGWAGIHSNPDQIGALATDMLVGMIHRGEKGIPAEPHEVLLPGEWMRGGTIAPEPAALR